MSRLPVISVVICTLNRAAYLERSLASLMEQTLALECFEVIVVDNGSTDHTSDVIRAYLSTKLGLRHLYEPKPSLSRARNRGLSIARAPIVAYLDDDARAEPQWLASLLTAFYDYEVAPGAVGGPVYLDWPNSPPRWLPQKYWSLYTNLDLGTNNHILSPNEYLVGANMAFRKTILQTIGGFDEELGRQGGNLLSGEETAVLHKVRELQISIYYAADAIVWHAVPNERLRKRWLLKRVYWDGFSQPILNQSKQNNTRTCVRYMLYNTKKFLLSFLKALLLLLYSRSESQEALVNSLHHLGRARSHLRILLSKI
ncbi:MAG: glycosyltransferase [Oscillochloridaceae bacterium umkhey_bin13]